METTVSFQFINKYQKKKLKNNVSTNMSYVQRQHRGDDKISIICKIYAI